RASQAEAGIERLRSEVDTLIVIPNDRLLSISDRHVSVLEAFKAADQVLLSGVQGITDLITTPGLLNLEFADAKAAVYGAGDALVGSGATARADRAAAGGYMAVSTQLLSPSQHGARGARLTARGGRPTALLDKNDTAQRVWNWPAPGFQIGCGQRPGVAS